MGYRCPVCGAPHGDGEHAANHLAFTALMRGGKHAVWLDEHVPDWKERTPGTLAERIDALVPETEHEHVTDEGRGHRPSHAPVSGGHPPGRESDEVVERVVREARNLTERMRGNETPSGK